MTETALRRRSSFMPESAEVRKHDLLVPAEHAQTHDEEGRGEERDEFRTL